MPLTTLTRRVSKSQYTPLSEHESETPATFFGANPVLHAHCRGCDLLLKKRTQGDVGSDEIGRWCQTWRKEQDQNNTQLNGDSAVAEQIQEAEFDVLSGAEVFIGSDALGFSYEPWPKSSSSNDTSSHIETNQAPELSLSIPYPAISLHAIQRTYSSSPSVDTSHAHQPIYRTREPSTDSRTPHHLSSIYLQVDPSHHLRELSNPDCDDLDDDPTVELLIIPPASSLFPEPTVNGHHEESEDASSPSAGEAPNQRMVNHIFHALSRCADLHPDPVDEDGERADDGAGPMLGSPGRLGGNGLPGEGGWITAENAHEFEAMLGDVGAAEVEDGVILGPGAGTRRAREENGYHEFNGDQNSGLDDGEEETKWRRTA